MNLHFRPHAWEFRLILKYLSECYVESVSRTRECDHYNFQLSSITPAEIYFPLNPFLSLPTSGMQPQSFSCKRVLKITCCGLLTWAEEVAIVSFVYWAYCVSRWPDLYECTTWLRLHAWVTILWRTHLLEYFLPPFYLTPTVTLYSGMSCLCLLKRAVKWLIVDLRTWQ